MHAWLTPDNVPSAKVLDKCLRVPSHLAHLVIGALQELTKEHNFGKHGDMTVDEVVSEMWNVYESYLEVCSMSIIGEIRMFAGNVFPAGWLPCDGQVYQKDEYPDLWAYLGSNYEYNETGFYVPGFQGRYARGRNPDIVGGGIYGPDQHTGQYTGDSEFTLSENQIPAHTHTVVVSDPSVPTGVSPGPAPAQGWSPNAVESTVFGSGSPVGFEPSSVVVDFAIYAGV